MADDTHESRQSGLVIETATKPGKPKYDFAKSVCSIVSHSLPQTGTFDPSGEARGMLIMRGEKIRSSEIGTIVKAPAHGVMTLTQYGDGTYWEYKPESKYIGPDEVTFAVKVNGKNVLVKYRISTIVGGPEGEDCPISPEIYRQQREWLKQHPDEANLGEEISASIADLDTLLRLASIDGFLADLSGATYSFEMLADGTVGQTTGQSVILDSSAAGHGWFVDATPDSNEEFLPTSNPNVWVARPGSIAEGKMDMLSVLMHEYGHVLGLEHSTDANDVMAARVGRNFYCAARYLLRYHHHA